VGGLWWWGPESLASSLMASTPLLAAFPGSVNGCCSYPYPIKHMRLQWGSTRGRGGLMLVLLFTPICTTVYRNALAHMPCMLLLLLWCCWVCYFGVNNALYLFWLVAK